MLKVVIFRGKETDPPNSPDPYKKIAGGKYSVYVELFEEMSKWAELYAVFGYENYLGNLRFRKARRYRGDGEFDKVGVKINADAVYDRSYKLEFPGNSINENQKVINCIDFKEFSRNKFALANRYPDYCPKTTYISDKSNLKKELMSDSLMVYKPITGMKGKGIQFGARIADFKNDELVFPGILQPFMETKKGIPGLMRGRHDLRIVIINKEIVWATVRSPKGSSRLANVAQGGTIEEVRIERIPKIVKDIAFRLADDFEKEFYNPLFSIDFGFCDGKPFIYEINDQIGFPNPDMSNNIFVKKLSEDLFRRAQ